MKFVFELRDLHDVSEGRKPGEGSLRVLRLSIPKVSVFDGDEPGRPKMVASLGVKLEVEQRPQSHSR